MYAFGGAIRFLLCLSDPLEYSLTNEERYLVLFECISLCCTFVLLVTYSYHGAARLPSLRIATSSSQFARGRAPWAKRAEPTRCYLAGLISILPLCISNYAFVTEHIPS